ncbi:MAG: hypothetical protein P4L40_23275 [Terracidiphilus sp.]|nr:hypothetical protein [Terracidiphilus sp.]
MQKILLKSLFPIVLIAVIAGGTISGCKKSSADPFPASGDVTGWQKTDGTRTFAAKDLWQYIDGDAEHFIQAGVVSTSTADYTYNGKLEAVVDVHTMGGSDGAKKLLETSLTSDAQHIQLGDECVAYAQSISFRKGKTLVRIVAYETNAETQQALLALARSVESRL